MAQDLQLIRNFCIIAHIDHGKSTLADRFLDVTGAISAREQKSQLLDRMDLEQERGITIKAQGVRLPFTAADGETYQLNLIDTPGHVDFSYEVSRSLAACDGALLVVDATQGVEAQTLANVYLAVENDLEIIPVFNKVDLPSSDVDRVRQEVEQVIGLDCSQLLACSAKTGEGVKEILEAVVERVPPPATDDSGHLRALIFDSWYDSYRGAVCMVRIKDGTVRKGDKVRLMATGAEYEATELGVYTPFQKEVGHLGPGEVGYLAASIKSLQDAKVGDTITLAKNPAKEALAGFKDVKPMVFCGIFPTDSDQYTELRDALEKLNLNDAAFMYEPETSDALGFGFRCGFLGLLHMEIVQERLEREYNLGLITTAPSVVYRVHTEEETLEIDNPSQIPDGRIRVEEPYFTVSIHVPSDFVGSVIKLCQDRRGEQQGIQYASPERVIITYLMPLAEVLFDFFDKLKSATKGYASMDYELAGYRENPLARLDMLLNGQKVDALSAVVHKDKAYYLGRALAAKLKKIVPRQQYEVIIQAAIGSKVISRETVRALRKDVTAKCYGGDISRKRKLLEKQKEGKKRMKAVGSVDIPQDAFHAILKVDD
ncbi:MAG: translation elongation factor 4 [Deltaproteobacteria bacterium]|nr:translation elongation factor 4 [Deltaproteobacteria bacterium]NND28503.1 elongation factor 4 [Myxococcales bacterium]MBT8463175.1 translation elongation factor 4 [Deltaproteobacteria bacterium]MBT8482374.1 translation elongation factor 4 [Deltaproteobacteria bacterium]NNK07009.1 elongation factor 4 [Myxococcales bacterium]